MLKDFFEWLENILNLTQALTYLKLLLSSLVASGILAGLLKNSRWKKNASKIHTIKNVEYFNSYETTYQMPLKYIKVFFASHIDHIKSNIKHQKLKYVVSEKYELAKLLGLLSLSDDYKVYMPDFSFLEEKKRNWLGNLLVMALSLFNKSYLDEYLIQIPKGILKDLDEPLPPIAYPDLLVELNNTLNEKNGYILFMESDFLLEKEYKDRYLNFASRIDNFLLVTKNFEVVTFKDSYYHPFFGISSFFLFECDLKYPWINELWKDQLASYKELKYNHYASKITEYIKSWFPGFVYSFDLLEDKNYRESISEFLEYGQIKEFAKEHINDIIRKYIFDKTHDLNEIELLIFTFMVHYPSSISQKEFNLLCEFQNLDPNLTKAKLLTTNLVWSTDRSSFIAFDFDMSILINFDMNSEEILEISQMQSIEFDELLNAPLSHFINNDFRACCHFDQEGFFVSKELKGLFRINNELLTLMKSFHLLVLNQKFLSTTTKAIHTMGLLQVAKSTNDQELIDKVQAEIDVLKSIPLPSLTYYPKLIPTPPVTVSNVRELEQYTTLPMAIDTNEDVKFYIKPDPSGISEPMNYILTN